MDEQPVPAAEESPAAPPTSKPGGVWVVVGVVLVVLVCVGALVFRPTSGAGDAERSAKDACQGFVKERLKAPATADFSGEAVTVDGKTYSVTGDVDAENSFGAKLRMTYTCVVTDAGDEWRLVSIGGL
jgi:hypothetical protein